MHITIITKTPVAGKVKTRLCPPCTPVQAAQVAAAALADTIDAVLAAVRSCADAVRPVILLEGEPGSWIPEEFDVIYQRGDGLAERLANGFADLGRGVIIGMDTPVAAQHLHLAVAAVVSGTDAIGLTLDGGYWVIGLVDADERVFDNVPMSTPDTGAAQLRQLALLGREVAMLPPGRDLDTVEDLRAIAASDEPGRLPQVAREVLAAQQV